MLADYFNPKQRATVMAIYSSGVYIGGGIEYWFAYVLALAVLLIRPQGLFGERIIERI